MEENFAKPVTLSANLRELESQLVISSLGSFAGWGVGF